MKISIMTVPCKGIKMFRKKLMIISSLSIFILMLIAQLVAYNHLNWMVNFNPLSMKEALNKEDIFTELTTLCSKRMIKLYLMDENYLQTYGKDFNLKDLLEMEFISFGIDIKNLHTFQSQIDPLLQPKGVDFLYVKNTMPEELSKPMLKNKVIAIFLQIGDLLLHMYVLHSREGFWWIGNVNSDPNFNQNKVNVGILIDNHINKVNYERALEIFFSEKISEQQGLYVPKNISHFLNDLHVSRFRECPVSKARTFNKEYRYITSQAFRYMHRSYKLLSRVSSIFFNLDIPFWLSSGTCLGYYRECNIIPYSNDVDIGIFSTHYTPQLVTKLQENNFTLKHKFGLPNDSLEYSFVVSSIPDVKLDVFYFYEEKDLIWNGATQPESRKKFKFTFPKFDLCWTEFISLKVRVPCDTQPYLEAIYGQDWNVPQEYWDWKSSPHNVKFNGVWPRQSLNETIQIFR